MNLIRKSAWYVAAVTAIIGLSLFAGEANGPDGGLSAAATQTKIYLRVEGVEGECIDALHKGCLEVLSYEQGVDIRGDPQVSEGNSDQGPRTLSLTLTRPISRLTPSLLLTCCRQTRIPRIALEVWREGGPTPQKLMTCTGRNAVTAVVRTTGSLTADGPMEELTFTCASMEWVYTEYDAFGKPKGEVRTQWPAR